MTDKEKQPKKEYQKILLEINVCCQKKQKEIKKKWLIIARKKIKCKNKSKIKIKKIYRQFKWL